ncbi:MAG TPA: site-specific DNA-methyltransferase [Candidatus Acidoferrales bacterium]|nr:site-specific DNA-methyltransferase [Candidatus Acidoferrales bacterium]
MSIYNGDVLSTLRAMDDQSIHCCVTSPPYWGLRDYGCEGQIGLEPTPEQYISKLVEVFREVRRVLRDDGTLWLNLGDSYFRDPGKGDRSEYLGLNKNIADSGCHRASQARSIPNGMKPKDLVGIPWSVAFALRADGWYLRQDIIWSKPNPMPESVRDRCTKAHEYMFLLSKNERYYYKADAIAEPVVADEATQKSKNRTRNEQRGKGDDNGTYHSRGAATPFSNWKPVRNKRSVWEVGTEPLPEAHFATFPTALIRPCILAGCAPGGVVLDPFVGSGTTLLVAEILNCAGIGIELNPEYVEIAKHRLNQSRFDWRGGFRL